MISVKNFINELNKAENKDEYIKSHIIYQYIDFEEKDARCVNIVNRTMYETVGDNKIFKMNRNRADYFFKVELIHAYTDIKLGEGREMLFDMNRLMQINYFNLLEEKLEGEFTQFKNMLNTLIDDTEKNEKDIISYIDTKIELINLLTNSLFNDLEAIEKANED